jgi:glycosyltransferase involved in cell wall biosynthesis
MRIAQIAHVSESVPPKQYGGSERIVSYLTEELVRLGHAVTLFASGDSVTGAELRSVWPRTMRNADVCIREAVVELLLERAFGSSGEFDVIHSHLDFLAFPLIRRSRAPAVTTVHGKLNLPELQTVYGYYPEVPLVSISYAQRHPCPQANWISNVYHGLPAHLYRLHLAPGQYLAFLGRISPEKGPEAAIRIAKQVGLPIRIAAKIDAVDLDYFHSAIEPLLDPPHVEFLGEVTDEEKDEFLGNAAALICPYWPESFGLVLIEALACGTPVITHAHGSFPEIITHGVTGFLCRTQSDMIEAIGQLHQIDRRQCRRVFDERFTAERMVQDYLKTYRHVILEHDHDKRRVPDITKRSAA